MSLGICCSADRNKIIGRPMIHQTVTSATVGRASASLVKNDTSGSPSAWKICAIKPRSGISASFHTRVTSVTENTDAQKKVARSMKPSLPGRFRAKAKASASTTKIGVLMATKRTVFHITWWKTSSSASWRKFSRPTKKLSFDNRSWSCRLIAMPLTSGSNSSSA